MILKFFENLSSRKTLILGLLSIPIAAVFFLGNFQLQLMPPYPYVQYEVGFDVPGQVASTIERKVTSEAERIFNGLPGLLSLESLTKHEKSTIFLRFQKGNNPNTVLLFIQEKMDRLKLMLPGEVKRITIEEKKRMAFPDITILSKNGLTPQELGKAINPYRDQIREIYPPLIEKLKFNIKLDIHKMAEARVSVDQVWKALQLNGLTYHLGKKKDLTYTLDSTYKDIETVKATIIGAIDDRPLRLKDVSSILPLTPKRITKLELWLDKLKLYPRKLKKELNRSLPTATIKLTSLTQWYTILQKPILCLLLLIGLQILIFMKAFEHRLAVFSILIFDVLFTIHYLFWIGMLQSEITLVDLTSFFLNFIVGTLLWMTLLGRIRTYFLPSTLPTFIQRGIAQASLFSITELLPCFAMILILSFLFSVPILLSDINLPSQSIILRYIKYGMPLTLAILSILPLLVPLGWLKKLELKPLKTFGQLDKPVPIRMIWLAFTCFAISIVLWYLTPYGIKIHKKAKTLPPYAFSTTLETFRGYGSTLSYQIINSNEKISKNDETSTINPIKSFQTSWMTVWGITPNGLAQLAKYDISMFQTALFDIQQNLSWGTWSTQTGNIPLHFSAFNLRMKDFSQLLIGNKEMNAKPIRLGLLLNPSFKLLPRQIFRSQLSQVDEISFSPKLTKGNFTFKQSQNFKPSPHTKHWFNQYKAYLTNNWIVLIFSFILMSLYLNSFFRGLMLATITFAAPIVLYGWLFVSRVPYHLDSLWIIWIPMWIVVAVVLLLSRMVDVERIRSNDRDIVIKEMQKNYACTVFWGIAYVSAALFLMGLIDLIPWSISTYFFKEGILISIVVAIVGYTAYFYLFRLFYISGDEYVENVTFKLFKWLLKIKTICKIDANHK